MRLQRDPRDRRYRERLAGSFLASLLIHTLLALLLFSLLSSSSQQGTSENVSGAEVVTLSRTSPVALSNQPVPTHAVPPVPKVRAIAPLRHAPLSIPQAQRHPVNLHELAKIVPSAPPNPLPVPQTTPQPNPQPTQNVFETHPNFEVPAAPVSVPTVAPVAVAIKTPPTVAPSPAPTSAPVVRSTPRPPQPVASPTAKPATPAPAVPKPQPSAAPVARATPAPVTGVPKPSPTSTATVARTVGTAPKPAPSGGASPGPHPGNGPQARSIAPAAPIVVRPTPTPRPRATAAPKKAGVAPNINAKLRALLPNNPVKPSSKQYLPTYSLRGRLEPTPPPEVLARTKYIYEVRNTGSEALVKMWVTEAHKAGLTTICTGWLVRYPEPVRGNYAPLPSNVHAGGANGSQVTIGGGPGAQPPLSPFDAGIAPIVDGIVSQTCNGRLLAPYAPSPASSP